MIQSSRGILAAALALCLVFAATAAADSLELKDGRIITGKYIRGTPANIHFEVDGKVKIYKIGEVAALYFGDTAPGAPSAKAPSATAAAHAPKTATTSGTSAVSGSGGTIAQGTKLMVRMIDTVDSDKNSVGDTFRASVEQDVVVNGAVLVGKGTDVRGELLEVKEAGKLTGKSELKLELKEILIRNQWVPITTGDYEAAGESRGKDTAVKVGAGAAIGAVIGAIAGGGKGAAIGAGVGAGAGAAIQLLTRGEQVKVPSETVLDFTLESDLVVPAAPATKSRRR